MRLARSAAAAVTCAVRSWALQPEHHVGALARSPDRLEMKAHMASSHKLTAVVIELLYEFTSVVVTSSHPTGGDGEPLATFRHHSGAVLSRPSLRDVAGAA